MAVPVIESTAYAETGVGDATSVDATKPSGVVAGDLLVIVATNENENQTAQFSDNLTGWNFVGTNPVDLDQEAHIGVFWREADGTEPATTTVDWVGASRGGAHYLRISGANNNIPIHQQSFDTATDSASHSVTGVTTTNNNCLILAGLSFDGGDGDPFTVGGTGWAKTADGSAGGGDGGNDSVIAEKDLATAGASGTCTITPVVTDGAAFFQIAINEVDPDQTAPVLSNESVSEAGGPTEVDLSVDTDEDNGILYYYFSGNSSETADTVKNNADGSQAISSTGTKTFTGITGWAPGTTQYAHFMHQDDAGNKSNVASAGALTTTAYTATATYDGGVFGTDSLLMLAGGEPADQHTGANNAAILTDSGESWPVDGFIDDRVANTSDGSAGPITDNDGTTITATLAGGTDNDWDTGDKWEIHAGGDAGAALANTDIIYVKSPVVVVSEAVTYEFYTYDTSADVYSKSYTINDTASGAEDGNYDVAVSTKGVPTLTLVTVTGNIGNPLWDDEEPRKKIKVTIDGYSRERFFRDIEIDFIDDSAEFDDDFTF